MPKINLLLYFHISLPCPLDWGLLCAYLSLVGWDERLVQGGWSTGWRWYGTIPVLSTNITLTPGTTRSQPSHHPSSTTSHTLRSWWWWWWWSSRLSVESCLVMKVTHQGSSLHLYRPHAGLERKQWEVTSLAHKWNTIQAGLPLKLPH